MMQIESELRILKSKRSLLENLRILYEYRELLVTWTVREIRARYRQSVLGFGWALIQPLVQIVVISIIFGRFVRIDTGDIPYPVFAYVAILPWSFFSGAVAASVPSIVNYMDLVTKIYFPREFLPLSAILSRLVDFAIATIIYVGLILVYNIPIYTTILWVPLLLIIQIILTAGIGMLGSAVSVFLRDISFAVPTAMQVWMYLTPVIYPIDLVPEQLRWLYMLNPMVGIINSYRRVVLDGLPPNFLELSISVVFALFLFVFSYFYFKRVEMAMSDII